jgi:hypothetical protein
MAVAAPARGPLAVWPSLSDCRSLSGSLPAQQPPSITKVSRFTIRRTRTAVPDGGQRRKSKPGCGRFRIITRARIAPRPPPESPYSLLEHPKLQQSILEKHSPDDADRLIDSFLY